ncbi:hypothetical protein HBI73_219130 [Parastagonospora nodorum]|nr:hypothetical protein HBI73_219130 [Parastagonospora nodorum]KAH5089822.1 hypothetical protein HBH72_221480 [Parastagonospora nodorum]KAH5113493.1 hypothetical protein HBH71_155450 [Parastagonospora nodorum]KAH5393861.1 hypothetical protein HBI32_221530 [Parastagonospora nodorum]KAH5471217.1 hypothetical protein HBI28_151480 [Parastagonospora nodorum]
MSWGSDFWSLHMVWTLYTPFYVVSPVSSGWVRCGTASLLLFPCTNGRSRFQFCNQLGFHHSTHGFADADVTHDVFCHNEANSYPACSMMRLSLCTTRPSPNCSASYRTMHVACISEVPLLYHQPQLASPEPRRPKRSQCTMNATR